MYIHVSEYADGGRSARETNADLTHQEEWVGPRRPGEPLAAFVEAAYNPDDEHGIDRLLEALSWLIDEIKRRKGKEVPAKAAG